jgi:hypothetical protein
VVSPRAQNALAAALACLAAVAVILGAAWIAGTASPETSRSHALKDTLPYAIAWSGAAGAMLASSITVLFITRYRGRLLILACFLAAALVALLVAAVLAGTGGKD